MLGQKIHHYIITRLIGEGGMASVYEATHEKLQTKVAIKVLNPMLAANSNIRQRFENEARFMASLTHPNITRVIDYEERPDLLAIILEFLEGKDLNVTIRKNGPLPLNETLTCFTQVLDAFDYAHRKGIVHRDVKPSNIFIEPGNIVKILDFGIAKLIGQGEDMTMTGTQMGTPVYMSPEQVNTDKTLDHRSDIYSLGVTLYYMLKGEPPYDSTTTSSFQIYTKIVHEPLPALGKYPEIEKVIFKATSKDRNDRYQTCQEFRKALLEAAEPKKSDAEKTVVMTPRDSEKTLIDIPEPVKKQPEPVVKKKEEKKPAPKPEKSPEKTAGTKKLRNNIVMALSIIGILVFVIMKFFPSLVGGIFSGGISEADRVKAKNLLELGKAQYKNQIAAGAYDSAVYYLQKAEKLDPENMDVQFYLGGAYYRQNQEDSTDIMHLSYKTIERSSKAFEKIITTKPDYQNDPGYNDPYSSLTAIWGDLAMKYLVENNQDSALIAFREGKKRGGFNEVVLENARNILNSCDPDAILFCRWDIINSPLNYLQQVENLRQDVKPLAINYFKEDWYFRYMKNTLGITFSFGETWHGLMMEKTWEGQAVVADNVKTGNPFTWYLPGNSKQELSVRDQVMLDIITTNKFQLPVHFSAFINFNEDVLNLYSYLRPEGLVYKLQTSYTEARGRLQQNRLEALSFTALKSSSIPSTDLRIVIDYIRNEYFQLINAYYNQKDLTSAKLVLNELETNLPLSNYPAYFDAVTSTYKSLQNKLIYNDEQRKQMEQTAIKEYMTKNNLTGTPSANGVYYIQTRAGSGKAANIGNTIKVHYTGKLLDGTVFDSSYDRGEPIEFELGAGRVIKGWEDAFFLRQAGSRAIIIIPYDQGYGSTEMAKMPAYSTLVFEVEILAVE